MQTFIAPFRALLAIALTIGLAACGGYTSVNLGGNVSGLTADGLVLANGGSIVQIPANATSYVFPNQIGDNASYAITIQSQPARLTCSVANASGNATGLAITWANVTCAQNVHSLGGTIGGLTVAGLVLTNGSDTVSPDAGSTTFTFTNKVPEGSAYGVAVVTQPPGLTCSVTNGTAVMGTADVGNVQVNCI